MVKKICVLVAILALTFAAAAHAEETLSIGTGPEGGSFYPVGGVLADIITKNVDGYTGIAEVTGAAVQNVKLLGNKNVEFGITINAIARAGYNGEPPFKEKYPNLRMFVSNFQRGSLQIFALQSSPINYIDELKGKRVAVGPAGHGSLVRLKEVFKVLGMGFGFDEIKPVYLPYGQSVTLLGDKRVEAAVLYQAWPVPKIKEFQVQHPVKLLKLRPEQRKALLETYPHYISEVIPKGTYAGQDKQFETVSTPNVILVDGGLGEELVYKITKALFDNLDKFQASHPSVKEFSLETVTEGATVPWHPGAVKYLKEKGVWKE